MRRRILVAVAVLGVLSASLGPAAARTTDTRPPPPLPPRLAGTTVLTGPTSAHMRVTVARDAVIDLTPVADSTGAMAPAALQTAGGGRGHVGFLLTSPGTSSDIYVLAARLPKKLQDGMSTIAGIGHGQTRDRRGVARDCVRCAIPAGIYDLHLLTTRRAAEVVVTIGGLGGRKQLEPARRTLAFGFGAGVSPRRGAGDGDVSEGGGMGLGMGWTERSTGVALTSYEMKLLPSRTPAPVGTFEVCRSAGRASECEDRLVAGAGDSAAGSGVLAASRVRHIDASMDWGTYGYARYKAHMSLLWVGLPKSRTQPVHPVAPAKPPGLQLRRWSLP